MDYQVLADLLFPNVTDTPESLEERFPLRNVPEGAVVTRMAPSPTGFVHLGNLVQGLTSERMAHQSGGVLFLRVEDTDAKREVPGAVEVLINTLKHYGISFDEGATIDGDNGEYSLLLGNAKGIDGPYTKGTYLWVEVENLKRLEAKIVEGPYIHHCVGIHEDVVPVLYEACKYIGIQPDLYDNNEEQVKAYLRGE